MAIFSHSKKNIKSSGAKRVKSPAGGATERFWNAYSEGWYPRSKEEKYLGDEWKGTSNGAADTLEAYLQLIRTTCIDPYIEAGDDVIELGVGGGKTTALLVAAGAKLTCVDISQAMIDRVKERLPGADIRFYKNDGKSLSMLHKVKADVFFSYDTLVHLDAQDIYHYLKQIPALLTGKRLAILHVANTMSEKGFERFVKDYPSALSGNRHPGMFSIMTDELFHKMALSLGYAIVKQDHETMRRDTIWVLRAPETT